MESEMDHDELKRRTKEFAKAVIALCRKLPDTPEARLIRGQLFRAGTSVAANYRSACRGRSKAEFIAKLGIVLEEVDESEYWLEIIHETRILRPEVVQPLLREAGELVAIFVSSIRTAKGEGKDTQGQGSL
jgi:four helix bundle protein